MKRLFRIIVVLYLIASVFTHPLLPGSTGYLAGQRGLLPVLLAREGLTVLIFLVAVILTRSRKLIPLYVFFCFCFVLITFDSVSNAIPISVALRTVLMVSLAFVLPHAATNDPKLLTDVVLTLKVIVSVSLAFSIYQTATIPGVYGTTMLGPRTFGAMASPLHLSYFAGIAAIFFATRAQPERLWVLLSFVVAIFTGGRAGILISLIAVLISNTAAIRVPREMKPIAIFIAGAMLLGASFVVSMPSISGRAQTAEGPLSDGRFEVWARALSDWSNSSVLEVMFGSGVGSGSNSLASSVDNFYFTDSTFVFLLLSFGVFGAAYIVVYLLSNFFRLSSTPVIAAWLIAALTQLYFELQPFCILVALCVHYRYEKHEETEGSRLRFIVSGRRKRRPGSAPRVVHPA